jgi:hypothetical protein
MKSTLEIRNLGQIKDITLPKGWVGGEPYQFVGGVGARSFREVHPDAQPGSTLGFYYRGLPIGEEAAVNFHNLIEKPAHMLTQAELSSLHEVLRDKAGPKDFTPMVARTEDINGKRVLVIEGRYRELQEDTFAVFIDASGDGRAVQEVYYQAAKDNYLDNLKAARDAIRSIRWK